MDTGRSGPAGALRRRRAHHQRTRCARHPSSLADDLRTRRRRPVTHGDGLRARPSGGGRAGDSRARRVHHPLGGRVPSAGWRRFLVGTHRRGSGRLHLPRGVASLRVDAPTGAGADRGRRSWTTGIRGGNLCAVADPGVVLRRAARGQPEGGAGRTCRCRSTGIVAVGGRALRATSPAKPRFVDYRGAPSLGLRVRRPHGRARRWRRCSGWPPAAPQ